MTELTEQEREEAFITLALSQKNAELYRRYGAMSPGKLDKMGISRDPNGGVRVVE